MLPCNAIQTVLRCNSVNVSKTPVTCALFPTNQSYQQHDLTTTRHQRQTSSNQRQTESECWCVVVDDSEMHIFDSNAFKTLAKCLKLYSKNASRNMCCIRSASLSTHMIYVQLWIYEHGMMLCLTIPAAANTLIVLEEETHKQFDWIISQGSVFYHSQDIRHPKPHHMDMSFGRNRCWSPLLQFQCPCS